MLLTPIFVVITSLRLHGTYLSLIVVYASFSIPFCMWLLRGYFATIPKELEDAASVDGTGRIGALFRVVMPLSAPGLAAASVIAVIPVLIVFLFIQRFLIQGLSAGALKG